MTGILTNLLSHWRGRPLTGSAGGGIWADSKPDWAYSSAYLRIRLHEEVWRSQRSGAPIALLVFNFPGHDMMATEGLARSFLRSVRPSDLAAATRPGEVVLCLLDCDRSGALAVTSRLTGFDRSLVRVGLTVYPDDGYQTEQLIVSAHSSLCELQDLA